MVNIKNLSQFKKKWEPKIIEELQNQLKDLIPNSIRGPMDKVFKYSEGQLAIVLGDTLKEGAQVVEKRLEEIAAKHKFKAKDMSIELPLRFREVTYPVDGQTDEELIKNVQDISS